MNHILKEVIKSLESEMDSLDGSISNKYWIIQGLHKAWEICHKADDEFKKTTNRVLELNNSFDLLKDFKVYYDKAERNVKHTNLHDVRVVTEFITNKINEVK